MPTSVAIIDALRAHGGAAHWCQLDGQVSRRALERAVAAGEVVASGGSYWLPDVETAVSLARQLRGIRTHRSAAEHWHLALPPSGPSPQHDIAIPPKAKRANVPTEVRLHYLELRAEDIDNDVLTPLATVAYCLRDLSIREALSVGDSALHTGQVELAALRARTALLHNRGSARARHRVELLDAGAANAFESCCRALLVEAGITGFETQVEIRHNGRWVARVDLAHRRLRIVIECDGFETHGTLDAMTGDCIRHTKLGAAGWRTLRFTWYQVMHRPDWVLDRVRDTIVAAGR